MKTKKRFTNGTRTHPTKGPVTAIAWSAVSRNSGHNFENPDLDAIWPANLIGDASAPALVELANDTLDTRIHRESYDWHPTTVQAARLGRADVYQSALRAGIAKFLLYRQGFGTYGGGASGDIQTEFTAVQTFAAQQALVQNYDGLLRLANAWPADWEVVARLPTEGGHRVGLEVIGGIVQAATVALGSADAAMGIRNPWPGQSFTIRDLSAAGTLYHGNDAVATVAAVAGHRLLIERVSAPLTSLTYDSISDSPNTDANTLGSRQLGKP